MTNEKRAVAARHREWLRRLPDYTGLKLSPIAEQIKVSKSTLTRPLEEGDDGTSTLSATTIAKVLAAFPQVPPPEPARVPAGRAAFPGFAQEAQVFDFDGSDPVSRAVAALVAGSNSLCPYVLRTRAVELEGLLPGDIVILDLSRKDPKPGDIVCATIAGWPPGKSQTVVRVFERAPPVKLLVARSLDPNLQHPIVIDDVAVVVMATVLPHRLRPGNAS